MREAVVFAILMSAGLTVVQTGPVSPIGSLDASIRSPGALDPGTLQSDASVPTRADFAGRWHYNEEFSIDTATGRPERGPRAASPAMPEPRPEEPATDPRAAGPQAGGGAEREVFGVSPFAPSPRAMREYRDMVRDLMEIAETLDFTVTDEAVTIVDDLDRSRTYPTDGSENTYRLGASEFQARVRWQDSRLVREIEGTFGFRMDETYFLSPAGDRLFIIMRVEGIARARPPIGADRVYDRVPLDQP